VVGVGAIDCAPMVSAWMSCGAWVAQLQEQGMVPMLTACKTRSLDFASAPEYTNRHLTWADRGRMPSG